MQSCKMQCRGDPLNGQAGVEQCARSEEPCSDDKCSGT